MAEQERPGTAIGVGGPHDIGGASGSEPIDRAERPQEDWEKLADAVHHLLVGKGLRRHDQLRRAIESVPAQEYDRYTYFERRVRASQELLVESGVVTEAEVEERLRQVSSLWRV